MPIYPFQCRDCGNEFEELVMTSAYDSEDVACPGCGSHKLTKQLSHFAVNGGGVPAEACKVTGGAPPSGCSHHGCGCFK